MADTDEVSDDLRRARRAIEDLGTEVTLIGPWEPSALEAGRWSLALELAPDGLAPGPIPAMTRWYVVVDRDYPTGSIDIMPAKEGGITETFPHQLPNDAGDDSVPWRGGKVCLVDTVRGHELAAVREEPTASHERLVWHVWRAIEWLRRASRHELLRDGEPFELPVFGQFRPEGATIAFLEGGESFASWQEKPQAYGLADLAKVTDQDGRPYFAVVRWTDYLKQDVMRPAWGSRIAGLPVTETAIWFRFDHLLVRPPWRAPQTWTELHGFADEQGVDLLADLRKATSAIRDDGKSHFVLLGFPLPRAMGEEPRRVGWVAFRLPPLNKTKQAKTPFPGFRTQTAAWVADRISGPLAGHERLDWVRCENWHPDELSARGRFEGGLRGRRVAVLGAGALGSVLAELLVRGGVHDLAIYDDARLEAGNLVRHTLSMLELASPKALSLAERLNALSPCARVTGYDVSVPPADGDARAALEQAEIVIDATASERVAEALGRFEWSDDRHLVSVSFSFAAEKLYLFAVSGDRFPVERFRALMRPWLEADERPQAEFPWEGTGCWSSVFPARVDDVALLAAIAARQLDERMTAPIQEPELQVYQRQPDGTVTLVAQN